MPSATTAHVAEPDSPQQSSLYKLPAPLRAIIGFLYLDGVNPDDDFLTRLQKLIYATGMCIAPCTASYGLVNVWYIEATDGGHSTFGHFVSTISIFAMVVIWVTCFALHKAAVGVPLWVLSAVWIVGLYIAVFVLTIAYPDYPCPHMFVQVAFLGLSLRSRVGYAVVGFAALGYLVAAYNEAAYLPATATETLTLATVPDPLRHTTFWQRLRGQANEYAVYVIIFACLELQMREAGRLTAASRASAELAAELAHALSRYDTAAAARRLEEARAAAQGKGDAGLLDAFEAIVANLNSYRPHLPNWLLPRKPATSDEEDADSDDISETFPSAYAADDDDLDAVGGPSAARRKRKNTTTQLCRTGSRATANRSFTQSDSSGRMSGARGDSGQLDARQPLERVLSGTDTEAGTKLTRVVVFQGSFRLGVGKAGSETARADYAIAAHAFVDRVFALADRAAGAVHTFVGDQLLVSWNAAAPAVQPEVKAARFVHKLGDDAGHAAVRVCGVASAFAAHVVMAGTAQQRSLALSAARGAGGDTFAERAQRLAARFGALLVDGRVCRAAGHALEFRGAGVVDMAKPFESAAIAPDDADNDADTLPTATADASDPGPTKQQPATALRPVFEVAGEHAEGNDEWMYVLRQQEQQLDADAGGAAAARPNAALCSAVAALAEGRRDAAVRLLDALRGTEVARSRRAVAALIAEYA